MDRKKENLKDEGAFNPKHKEVKDKLFKEKDFFDPRDLVQVKYEMLRRVKKEDKTVSKVVKNFGFSRPTFYQIKDNFNKEGLPGLLPKKRGPQKPHKLTPEVMIYIKRIIPEKKKVDYKKLAQKVEAKFSISVHPRSIRRALKQLKKNSSKQGKK
jgi:transposase